MVTGARNAARQKGAGKAAKLLAPP
jgi:hypothetical protein